MKLIFLFVIFLSTINLYAANPIIEPAGLDFYKESISIKTGKSVLEKLSWDEIVVPSKKGRKIEVLLKTKGLKEFADLTYQIKLFRQDDYPNGKFKTIELRQTEKINEFSGEVIFIDSNEEKNGRQLSAIGYRLSIFVPQGDDGILEVSTAEGAPDGGWEAEYFLEKLIRKGYKNRGNATFFSFTDEGTVEEHEKEGVPALTNEFLQFGGVEKIIIDADFDNSGERPYFITPSEWDSPGFNPVKDWLLVKNQADIFYYSFHGEHESNGALISKVLRDDWKLSKRWPAQIVPKKTRYMLDDYFYRTLNDEIGDNWNLDLEWVYLAGCSVLDYDGEITAEWANFHNAKYNSWYDTRPGLFFAKNLLNSGSSLHGIIGFAATGKSDHVLIDECLNYNDSIVGGWKNNEEIFHMFLAPSILYHPEYENDTFAGLDDSDPDNNKLIYWCSYQPATYSFPQKKRVTVNKLVDLNVNAPRTPDCLMVENIPALASNPGDPGKLIFNYYPAYFPERENISGKRFDTKNLTPVLSWGYFSPEYKAAFDKENETLNEINPGIVTFENEKMKNYGINMDGPDDRIIEQWQIQVFNTSKKLIIDKTFSSEIIKSGKPNLLWEAGYKIKQEEKLNHNSLYFFRVKGKGRNGLWSPFSRIQWFKTK